MFGLGCRGPATSTSRPGRIRWLRALPLLLFSGTLFGHGPFHDRVEAASERIRQSPEVPALYLERALVYRDHGDWSEALADIDAAESLDPTGNLYLYYRGLVNLDAQRPSVAEDSLRAYVEARPDDPRGYLGRARALKRLGRFEEAAGDFERLAVLVSRPAPEFYVEWSDVLRRRGDVYWPQALAVLEAGIARLGPVVTLVDPALDLETDMGAYESALARVQSLIERSQRAAAWLTRRGEILARAGRPEDAKQSFQAAIRELDELPGQRRSEATARLRTRAEAGLIQAH